MARQQADKAQTHSQCFVMQKTRALEKTSLYALLDNAFLSPSTISLKLKRYTEKRSVRFKWLGKHWLYSVLVSLECHNKKPQTEGLNNRCLCSDRSGSPSSRSQQGWFPGRPLFRACRQPPFCSVLTQPCLCIQGESCGLFLVYEDTGAISLGLPCGLSRP